MKKGRFFIISAPSGCGKSTICEEVLRSVKGLKSSISATTRKPRPGEKNKKNYYYISREAFEKEIKKGSFLEWEENFGHFYGTPKCYALKEIKKGKNLLLNIDVKGAVCLKKKFPGAVLIFIKPPSLKELSRRLNNRNSDKGIEIATRLKVAKKELMYTLKYDYVVVNENLETAVAEVVAIIKKKGGYFGLCSPRRVAKKRQK